MWRSQVLMTGVPGMIAFHAGMSGTFLSWRTGV
jgi:hypothetical protein